MARRQCDNLGTLIGEKCVRENYERVIPVADKCCEGCFDLLGIACLNEVCMDPDSTLL